MPFNNNEYLEEESLGITHISGIPALLLWITPTVLMTIVTIIVIVKTAQSFSLSNPFDILGPLTGSIVCIGITCHCWWAKYDQWYFIQRGEDYDPDWYSIFF